ncbi:MAG: redoxin domain-containing protein [Nitrospirota bacterium]
MKNIISLFILVACLIIAASSAYAVECPEEGGSFPELLLPVPQDAAHKDYLGIQEKGSFKISEIKAPVVIVEIFSMYCPYCQKEAPLVNELYNEIDKRDLEGKIKIIGIGAGNTPFEVQFFKKQYDIAFPLFPDETFAVHKAIGDVRTPYFFVFETGGESRIFYSKAGSIEDPKKFLDLIIKKTGI